MRFDIPVASIRSPETGRLIGGRVVQRHEDNEVTILWAEAIRVRGIAVSAAGIRKIEEGTKQRAARFSGSHGDLDAWRAAVDEDARDYRDVKRLEAA